MKRIKTELSRRDFVKTSAFVSATAAGASLMVGANPELEIASANAQDSEEGRTTALAQCPYCGVGCGTIIQVENGKIVSMRPDKDHPTKPTTACSASRA
jgi:nitrate reductase NapA